MPADAVPNGSLASALRKALGTCNACRTQIEYYEELAKAAPEIDPQVTELRMKLEHLDQLCRTGLLMNRPQSSDGNNV